jgi:hypothetical protein
MLSDVGIDIGVTVASNATARAEPDESSVLVIGNFSFATITGVKVAISIVLSAEVFAITSLTKIVTSLQGKRTTHGRSSSSNGGGTEISDTTEVEVVLVVVNVTITLIIAWWGGTVEAPAGIEPSDICYKGSDSLNLKDNIKIMSDIVVINSRSPC